jgi:hypothetical protein
LGLCGQNPETVDTATIDLHLSTIQERRALSLRDRVSLSPQQRLRLVGVGLSNFNDPEDESDQRALFD